MSCRRFSHALVLAVLVTLAAPAWTSAQGALGRIPTSGYPGEPDWGPVIRDQEAGRTCKSREDGRLVVRHPPIPENYQSAPDGRMACKTSDVITALREGQPVELENVVLTGPLDLRNVVVEPILQAAIQFPRGGQQHALLQAWLDERRREHRAPDALAGQTEFRPIVAPLVIRNSWIESIDASIMEPVLFLEPVDLRGSRVRGLTNVAGAIFKEPVSLEAAQLLGPASFAGAHFDAGLDLSRARLGAATRFDGATFGTRALSRSPDRRRLVETPALFTAAAFTAGVSFRDAVFQSRADYQKTAFAGDTDFGAARFQQRADFGHAHFIGPLDASHAIFEMEARFPNATFDKAVSFRRAQFHWRADFGLATFNDAASTFREARFGPSLPRFLLRIRTDPATWPRWMSESGYDFRHTHFPDRGRALARSEFEIHEVFAAATLGVAAIGFLICLAFQRRPLLRWRRAPDGAAEVATVTAAPPKGTRVPASPRQRLADGAILLAAYALLAFALMAHYQANAGFAVDLWVSLLYPVAGAAVWIVAVGAARVAFDYRARRVRADTTRPDPPPPRLDYFDLAYHVPRSCDEFVARFVTRVSTGVLGLAGPRGAGRSSLARAVMERLAAPPAPDGAGTAAQGPILAVTAPSPPSNDLLPFFTVLFRRVSEAARSDLRRRLFKLERNSQIEDTAGELIESPPPIVLLPIGVVLAAMALFVARPWRPPIHSGDASDSTVATALRLAADWSPMVLLASVLLVAVVYYWRLKRRTDLRRALHGRASGLLYISTERVLESLAFEQSTSEEREGSLSLPYGVGLRRRQSRALKERAVTLPVILDDFRRYVEELRSVYPRGVVVHIDDADRIEEQTNVRDLLLRIKATLVGGVLYLVPLPDTVLEGSGLRARGPADVVAGLLDDLAFIPPMSTAEGLRMLARRQFFAPDGAAAGSRSLQARDGLGLAICLVSGGMPKEILRLLRRVSTESDEWTTRGLLDRTWREARDSAAEAVRRSGLGHEVQQRILDALETFLARPGAEAPSVSQLLESVAATPPAPGEAADARAAITQALMRLAQRRLAVEELQHALADLGTWEREMVADTRLLDEAPWVARDPLDRIRAAFLRDATVVVGTAEKRASA